MRIKTDIPFSSERLVSWNDKSSFGLVNNDHKICLGRSNEKYQNADCLSSAVELSWEDILRWAALLTKQFSQKIDYENPYTL